MKRALMTGAILLALHGHANAAIIASLIGDFTSPVFPIGWQYLRNTGPIGTSATYSPLLWDAAMAFYDVNPGTFPDIPPVWGDYTLLAATFAHPGPGTVQGAALNQYLVVAYTLQPGEAGSIDLVNGSLAGIDPTGTSNGWDVRTFVGDSEVGPAILFDWSASPAAFSRSLGIMNVGDTLYVGLGPRGDHLFDSAAFDFTLTSTPVEEPAPVPEPASAALAIGLATAFGARRRSSTRQTAGVTSTGTSLSRAVPPSGSTNVLSARSL